MIKQIKTMEQLKDSRLLYDKKIPAFGYMIIITITILLSAVVFWSMKTPKIYIIKSSGIVQSTSKNYAMSPYTGEITAIHISEGTKVEEGDILFEIKSGDLDLQGEQLEGQRNIYETQIAQYQKLVNSIKDDTNYFDQSNKDDSLYYSQYEAYKSQVKQNEIDTTTYQNYGYTDEQIEAELVKNQNKITEVYYTAIKSAEDAILQSQAQLDSINAQLDAIGTGQEQYSIKASTTGTIHMLSEYKAGMVVQATQALASISSENDKYMIQANISAEDAARIRVGDKADIAVSGLTQSVYGTISGKVTQIDSDLSTAESSSSEGTTTYFKIQIEPDYTYLVSKSGDKVNLSNGLITEARIQYDKVTYFNYVLEGLGVLTR
ncbi:HlyD family secretion protein [Candidatus Galacturonibacter soehngenii]|uniref:HlyD family efflux transporter periplasmic adaptor subunit n=1 Tax=Candidatus Galacturonatibacter soehngenii TaxID=2307010 RepID=A0A7V7QIF4_9FIRM|nr:HlyD family efflux transporter periplasmic adaptor subunit [Candidatus Galacturonibacter soehngenii]KAB1435905.1 HlyD family efflux transporter periplasmic adaptor subunit [Candidatus Galacturonibacter soehngenii]